MPWGPDALRIRVTVGPRILDTAWALTEPIDDSLAAEVAIDQTMATVRNGKISARLTDGTAGTERADGRLELFRHPGTAGGAGADPVPILAEHDYVVGCHDPGSRIFQQRTGAGEEGLFYTEHHFVSRRGERLYGMGLNATGGVDLKGCVIDLYQRHFAEFHDKDIYVRALDGSENLVAGASGGYDIRPSRRSVTRAHAAVRSHPPRGRTFSVGALEAQLRGSRHQGHSGSMLCDGPEPDSRLRQGPLPRRSGSRGELLLSGCASEERVRWHARGRRTGGRHHLPQLLGRLATLRRRTGGA